MMRIYTSIGRKISPLLTPLSLSISFIAPLVLWAIIFDSDGGEPYFLAVWFAMFYVPISLILALVLGWTQREDHDLRGASFVFCILASVAVIVAMLVKR